MAQRTTKKASAAQPAADLPPPPEGLTKEETRSVEKRRRLRAAVVYEIIRVEGEGELARTKGALWWSALGAGLSIGFSVLAQGLLKTYLPSSPGAWIVEALGYSVGFLIVILSRQQLFTENTLTAVLPVIARRQWDWIWVMLRLWGIVLAGNLVGCLLFAAFLAFSGALSPEIASAVHAVGSRARCRTTSCRTCFIAPPPPRARRARTRARGRGPPRVRRSTATRRRQRRAAAARPTRPPDRAAPGPAIGRARGGA